MTTNEEPLRLESLLEIAQGANSENAEQDLLGVCIEKSVRVYFPVPPNHVVAVHEYALVDSRSTQPGARPILAYPGRIFVNHAIRWLAISNVDLKCILDAGVATVACHLNGGLVDWYGSLIFRSFDYCVIRRDSPDLLSSPQDLKPVRLPRDCVFPTEQEIRFKNLFVSRNDGADLRKAIAPKEVPDKWNHKVSAPNVFQMYALAHQSYDQVTIVHKLIADDKLGVFSVAVANTAGRILNVGVGKHAEAGLKVEKISSNEMNTDYSDPSLSKRMSLVLLATDCWIHDRELIMRMELELEPQRSAVQQALSSQKAAGTENLKMQKTRFAEIEMKARSELKPKLYMQGGLDKYLQDLGFSSNQALHLDRIIKGAPVGGIHVQTKKKAASRNKV